MGGPDKKSFPDLKSVTTTPSLSPKLLYGWCTYVMSNVQISDDRGGSSYLFCRQASLAAETTRKTHPRYAADGRTRARQCRKRRNDAGGSRPSTARASSSRQAAKTNRFDRALLAAKQLFAALRAGRFVHSSPPPPPPLRETAQNRKRTRGDQRCEFEQFHKFSQ